MNSDHTAQGGSKRDLPTSPDPAVNPDNPTVPNPDDDPLMNEQEDADWPARDGATDEERQSVEQPYEYQAPRKRSD
ncbi:MAG: hypothetical protein ACN6NZ_04400 [Burkholderiales bacterium]